jgi:5-methylcytosine-specific restriction endonuclease McrA
VATNHYFRLGKIKVPQQYVNTLGLDQTKQESDMTNFTLNCKWCLETFTTIYETKIYCTKLCAQRARDLRKRIRNGTQRPIHKRNCKGCADPFITRRKEQLYCSQECRNWMREQVKRETARRRGESQWSAANRPTWKAKIFYKNQGQCQLCNSPIDLRLKSPDPMSFSIDHIVPVSLGGTHEQANLQAAHLVCNSRRGNKPISSPLV